MVLGRRTGFGPSFDLADLDGTNDFAMNGETAFDSVGNVVAAAGDVNADGVGDVLVGVENGTAFAGNVYVVYGQRTSQFTDLALAIEDGPDPLEQGAPIDYTVSVMNDDSDDATAVTVTTTLAACLRAPATVGCLEDPFGAPTCTLPDVQAGSVAGFTITAATANCPPTEVSSTAEAQADEQDPDALDNSAGVTTVLSRRNGDINADGCIDRTDQFITVLAVRRGI
jgi:hypothetical protein